MNRDNIQYTIDLLKQAQNFNINSFQYQRKADFIATDVEELHTCGNSACIAGYIAISPRWQEMGGHVHMSDGCPILPEKYVSREELRDAYSDEILAGMVKFWGLPLALTEALIYGAYVGPRLIQLGIIPPARPWKSWEKEDAVSVFEQILTLEL